MKKIGEKIDVAIKVTAVVLACLEILAVIICAAIYAEELEGWTFLIILAGAVAVWLTGIIMYGFGEIISLLKIEKADSHYDEDDEIPNI